MTEKRTGEMSRAQASPFGARLRRFREAAGLTQEELATRADLGAKNISDLERGVRKHPYPHTVRSLADALQLSEEERTALFAAVPKRGGRGRAARAVAPEPTLPEPPTPLVGRERDLEEVKAFLARPEVRLFTLTGTGGVGKTRLAVQAAWDAADLFPDGVAFVALASVGSSSLVVPTVCRTLGLRETEGTTPREALRVHLRDKELLLVLDNFEHVLEVAPEVAELIGSSANLTVLCTSRAPLHVRGEQEYPVAPLALPASTRAPEPAEVLASPSGRLFAERAQAASPTFSITENNAAAVAAICWRLAGLPLALELAAAKSRCLDPTTLLSRLDRALSTGSTRDVPDRQRTLRATLDWSYDLLSVPERALFRRLSVFAGNFSFEAAEAVGPAGEVGPEEILDLLGGLAEQSLLVAEVTSGQEVRYGMLEPVRQYALEKLEQSGDAEDAHCEHASFFLGLAERAHPELMGGRQVEWLDRLDQDYSNLRAAMSWALGSGHVGTAARMGWALGHFWWIRGHHREGRRWMELVLEHDLSPALRARALVAAGTLAFSHGDYERCESYAKEGFELSVQVGDELRAAWARVGLGVVATSRTDHETAAPHLQEALRSFRELDEEFGVARMITCLGMVALMRGEAAEAVSMFEEGLAVARRIRDRTSAYITLYSLALMALSRGDHDNAVTLFKEGIKVSEQVGDLANVAYCLKGLGMVAGTQNQLERCARLFGVAEGLLEAVGSPVYNYYEPDPYLYKRTLSTARSRLGEAAFEEAWDRGRAMTFEQAIAYALSSAERSQEEAKYAEPPPKSANQPGA